MMFKRTQWIPSSLFKKIFKKSRVHRNTYVELRTLPSDSLRVGVIIPKKIIKKRVDRNRQKRRILSILRKNIAPELSMVFAIFIKKDTRELDTLALETLIQEILSKVK